MGMVRNIFSNWTNIGLSILSVFIIFPFMTRTLGEEQYGIWLYIASITGYFELLKLGVPLANVRYIAKYNAENDREKVNQVLSSNLLFFSIVGGVVAVIGSIFSFFLDRFFFVSNVYISSAKIAMLIATINVAISFGIELFQGVLFALQKFVPVNIIKNNAIVLRVVLFYTLVNHNNGIIVISSVITGITAVQGIATYALAKIHYKTIKLSPSYVNKEMFSDLTKYSLFVMLMQLAGMISFQTDAIVIGTFISVASVLTFTIAGNMLNYLMQFTIGISAVLMPRISSLEATGDSTAISDIYYRYSKITFFLVLPVCLFLTICGGDFIALWMGEKFRVPSGDLLIILTISYLFLLVQRAVAFPILMGTSEMRFLSLLMIVTSVINLLLSMWWGKIFGLAGVAWGTTVPNLMTVIGVVWFMSRRFRINIITYILRTMTSPILAAAPFAVALILTKKVIAPISYLNIATGALISLAVYCCIIWAACYPKGIRASLAQA